MSRRGRRRSERAAFELLRRCALGRPLDPDWVHRVVALTTVEDVLAIAAYHGVSGLAHEALRATPELPGPLIDEFGRRHAAAVHGHMRGLWTLDRVRDALDGSGVRWAVVKGPAIVEGLYGGIAGRRAYADLDVLVDPAAFATALSTLADRAFELRDRNWAVIRREMRGELHLTIDGGLPLDLHWDIVNMYRGRMRVDTAGIVARARPRAVGDVEAPVLEPEDVVVHVALHAALSGGDRLLWLKDLERASVVWTIDWDVVVRRALAWRVARPVGLILSRAADTLGAAVPARVLDALVDPSIARIAASVERLSPWQHAMGRLAAPTRLVARGSAHGLLGGTAWIAWRSLRNLDPRQRLRHDALTPRGDETDRKAFIDAVEQTVRRP